MRSVQSRAGKVRWRGMSTGAKLVLLAVLAVVGCAAGPGTTDEAGLVEEDIGGVVAAREREQIMEAMKQEMARSMRALRYKDYEAPYFVSYQLEDARSFSVTGRFGAIDDVSDDRLRQAYVEVRVGDYGFDNHATIPVENYRVTEYEPRKRVPLTSDHQAIRGALWLLTDEQYKKALSDYLSKKGGAVYAPEAKTKVPSFSKEKPQKYRGEARPMAIDKERWKGVVERLSKMMTAHEDILDSEAELSAMRVVRYMVNSEGTDIIDEEVLYSLRLEANTRAPDGMLLDNGRHFYARTAEELPDEARLVAETKAMLDELLALRAAPTIDPYTGPAILESQAAGVLFHEAVGHRLEGERQSDEEEGRTFKGRVNKLVLPRFLSVYDDPTRVAEGDTQLNGHYAFDDEGVPAQRVTLVKDGILKGFLKSRTPIEGSLKSNGHGRSQGTAKPMARMGNLIVEAAPDHRLPFKELKARLIAEVKRQNKPFGLIIRDITGGSTNTSGYGYQAFKGIPRMVYRVDPKTGKETLVRGVELVGTPLASINKIVAAGDTIDVFNGYCGAESGYVPVSALAPPLLTTEIELQRRQTTLEKAPLLQPPWKEGAAAAPAKRKDPASDGDITAEP